MISPDNFARPSQVPELDELFKLLAAKKRKVHQYSRRYKKNVKFYSIHRVVGKNSLECKITGPDTKDLRFKITCDKSGYLIEMIVGTLSDQSLDTMNRALSGLAGRMVSRELSGFDTSTWNGYYLWVVNPTEDVLPTFEEAIALGLMSREFVNLCLEWGISIKKYPKE